MKRIAINGSNLSGRSYMAKAFSAMTGMGIIVSTPYSLMASRYKLDMDKSKCHWPDSFIYCMGAFTQRVMIEQKFEESYISDGGVFNEICWIKCRFPHLELIYERSMIESLEKIIADYAINEYDFIFHIDSGDSSDTINRCLKQIYLHRQIKHHLIDGVDKEDALNQMLDISKIKPVLSTKYVLLKFEENAILNKVSQTM